MSRLSADAGYTPASDLYSEITNFFIQHLRGVKDVRTLVYEQRKFIDLLYFQGIDNLADEELLQYYADEWNRYVTSAAYINRLFSFINRHWVRNEWYRGREGIYEVYTVRS